MVDGDISCPSVGNSDGRPWGDQVTVPGEFCWPPMGSFAWPPSQIVEGHTLVVWNDGGITCEVSFHGHSQANADLDLAVADATVLVAPRGR